MCSSLVGSLWVNLFSFSQGFSLHALVICGSRYYKVLTKQTFFKNYFHVSLQVGKTVMKEKCLWCMVMRLAGAMLFILRGPFHIRKDPNLQRPGREHVPGTALETGGTVQQKGQKKTASTELEWQHWPSGKCESHKYRHREPSATLESNTWVLFEWP